MKKLLTIALASIFSLAAFAQNDTLYYPLLNGSGFSIYGYLGGGYIAGPNIDGTGVGQTYETSSGDLTSFIVAIGAVDIIGTPDTFVAEVYNVGPNGVPFGAPLATKEFRTDSLVTGPTIGEGFNLIEFDSPVAVSGKFAITFDFDYNSTSYYRDDSLAIITNSDGDGLGLRRSIAEFGGQWFPIDVAYGGLDFDLLIFPILTNVVPGISITSRDLTRCSASVDTLSVTVSGFPTDESQLVVDWSPTTGLTNPYSLSTQVNIDAAVDSYTVSIYDAILDSTYTAGVKYTFQDVKVSIDQANPVTLACGSSTTLSATASGLTQGSNFSWSNGTAGFSTTVSQAGNYTISGTNAAGCSAQATVTVNLNVTQVANFDVPAAGTICENHPVTLSNTSTVLTGWDFTWYLAGDTFTNVQDLTANLEAGSYPVRLVADSAGLCSVEVTKNVSVQQICTSIEDVVNGDFVEVYPNPSTGVFSLNLNDVKSNNISVRVSDLSGKVVFSQDKIAGNSIYNLNLNGFAEGVYLLQVTSEAQTLINKLQLTK